jgi:hypothetical protein
MYTQKQSTSTNKSATKIAMPRWIFFSSKSMRPKIAVIAERIAITNPVIFSAMVMPLSQPFEPV